MAPAAQRLPVAQLRGVSKAFGQGCTRVQALQDVDLPIYAGELTLIEGPSGSGKTTLLHILGLLQRADEGEVWIGGRRLDALPESRLAYERRRNVVLIFQGVNLLESLTVQGNVAVAHRLANGRRRRAAVRPSVMDHLRRMDLEKRANHLPRELSGGEKQRTAIARALACPGALVLADEPTANLDWKSARQVVERLAELAHRDGRAVVMVTHDSRVEPFADRIVKLEDGRVRGDARVHDGVCGREAPMTTPTETRASTEAMVPARPEKSRRRGRLPLVAGLGFVAVAAGLIVVLGRGNPPQPPVPSRAGRARLSPSILHLPPTGKTAGMARPTVVAAAPAVVEPVTHLVSLQTQRGGRIKAVLKQAGDRIVKGEPLVLLDDAVPAAAVATRRAELQLAEAKLAELLAWHRPEERLRRKAALQYAQVLVDRAQRELTRVDSLFDRSSASKTERDRATEDYRLAIAALEEARQVSQIASAGPTLVEISVSQAQVARARAALDMADKELSYYTIVSPLDGHVIYRHLEPGEVVDPRAPAAILSIGNLDHVRLRAEVDEADIQLVYVGQKVVATADAYAERRFTGQVVHLEPMMGRTSIRTERTTEQKDTKVREVLIEFGGKPLPGSEPLPGSPRLPIGLQMTVRFLAE